MENDNNNEALDHSDDELDDDAHKNLIKNVLNFSYTQHVKKSTRTEPTLIISEFDLVKAGKNVHVGDLASVLERKGKQQEIGKQLKRAEQKLTTLPKPLEKPQTERIHRAVAYKKAQNELGKWDPIVSAIRSSTHTTFPLHSDSKLEDKVDEKADWGYQTELQKELAAIEPEKEVDVIPDEGEFAMTMEEMLEKRRETAKMRAHESYKIAKARRQKKIKSKKYHRVQRKEKMKQQMKEFELLQKTDPEAALEKLGEIERARAEERMSLRHKSTGKWARNLLVRAKYDKESRQVLAQQLSVSRDLTQKVKKAGDSDSEPDVEPEVGNTKDNPDNPWLDSNIKVSEEVDNFVSGYRKFWEESNAAQQIDTDDGKQFVTTGDIPDEAEDNGADDEQEMAAADNGEEEAAADNGAEEIAADIEEEETAADNEEEDIGEFKALHSAMKRKLNVKKGSLTKKAKLRKTTDNTKKLKNRKKQLPAMSTTEWVVTDAVGTSDESDIDFDHEFNKIDGNLRRKLTKKVESLKKAPRKTGKMSRGNKSQPKSEKLSALELLALPKENPRPVIDEELDETAYRGGDAQQDDTLSKYEMLKLDAKDDGKEAQANLAEEIDPTKFIQMKPTKLDTAIPDLFEFDDNEETDQRAVISEAFQDDDVVDQFEKEKQGEIDENKPKDIDLSLPGWGAWGGKDIKVSPRKKERFMIKFPEEMKRKDSNKGDLIINENANTKVRAHLVSEVPFPFKNVKDYEASIRAPIGSTFVPETAFRRLTQPAVTTKMGTVIEPMTEEVLVKKKKEQ